MGENGELQVRSFPCYDKILSEFGHSIPHAANVIRKKTF